MTTVLMIEMSLEKPEARVLDTVEFPDIKAAKAFVDEYNTDPDRFVDWMVFAEVAGPEWALGCEEE